MRPYFAALLFAVAALAAACGGGGGSSAIVPPANTSPNAPHYGAAALTLKIPPQSRIGSLRRPAYVSPNTQSVQIYVYPVPAPSVTPSPQTFPVATPSPCTQAADGSKTCTFDVQAPYGQDRFVINTYSVPNPGPSDAPLATFDTGVVTVTAGASPPPISFTLTGVVSNVAVAMQRPDPTIAQSTQIWTVASPLPPSILAITPKDASGAAILTDTFSSPITVTLSPANAGVSLALGTSQCSPASSISGATVTITCAKDLASVTYTYNGTIARDSSKNVVDHYAFSAHPQSTNAQPAVFALTGTTITQPLPLTLPTPIGSVFPWQFIRQSNGTFYYLAGYNPNSAFGIFDPSSSTQAPAATLPFVAAGMAIDQSGDIWVGVNNTGSGNSVQCFTSVSSTPANTFSLPSGIAPFALTTDTSGNIWYYGMDVNHTSWAGYFSPGSGCSGPGVMPYPVSFSTIADYPQATVAASNGNVWLLSNSNGSIYSLNTSSAGYPSPPPIGAAFALPPGSYFGEALAVDGAGNLFGSFPPNATLAPIIGELPSGSTTVTATSLEPGATVGGLGVFPATGAAARLAYADGFGIGTLDISASGMTNLQIAPVARSGYYAAAFFDANGDPWLAYVDLTGNAQMTHLIRTSVWTIANPSLSAPTTGGTANIAISERDDSGPFTVTNISDPTVAATAAPYPGIDHLLPLQISPNVSTSPIPLAITVRDVNGRSQTITFSVSHYIAGARRHSSDKIPFRPRSL